MIVRRLLTITAAIAGLIWMAAAVGGGPARADYFNYPCTYPFVGGQADIHLIIEAGGQYCDGPMEINGSHYHCWSGGGGIGGGAIGLAPAIGGFTLGGFGGSGFGAGGGRCEWQCPDMTKAPAPNPPAAWVKHLVVNDADNACRDHMAPAGETNVPQTGAVPDGPPPEPEAAPPPTPPEEPSPFTPGSPMTMP